MEPRKNKASLWRATWSNVSGRPGCLVRMLKGSKRPSDAWFSPQGLPSFRELLELPDGVDARVICHPTDDLTPVAAQPLGNLFAGRLADTTPSSAFSSAQSGQEGGGSGSGTVGSTAETAVEVFGPVLGHSDHSSTASEGTALLAPSPMTDSAVTDRLQVTPADTMPAPNVRWP